MEDRHPNGGRNGRQASAVLSAEMRHRVETTAIGGIEWYREVLRRLEDMHLILHPPK